MHTNYIFSALALALPVYSVSSTASMGCYSDIRSFATQGPYTFASLAYCEAECAKNDFKVAALSRGNMCYCGNQIPSDSAKVADDKCDVPCTGYPKENCGGMDTYTVIQATENVKGSSSGNSTTVEPTAATAAGGIIVAPSAASSSASVATAASKSANAVSKSASGSGASATASPTPTDNAAGTVRAGSSLLGAVVAGVGLLL